jgi:hypothetical protein
MKALKHGLAIAGIVVCTLPAAFIVTFLLSPLWSWVEAKYGIESIGHSGPSDWCFELVWFLLLSPALGAYGLVVMRKHRSEISNEPADPGRV